MFIRLVCFQVACEVIGIHEDRLDVKVAVRYPKSYGRRSSKGQGQEEGLEKDEDAAAQVRVMIHGGLAIKMVYLPFSDLVPCFEFFVGIFDTHAVDLMSFCCFPNRPPTPVEIYPTAHQKVTGCPQTVSQ